MYLWRIKMPIERVKIRAKISIGGLTVETPFIQSFNVRRARGQIASFDAALKVSHDEINGNITGEQVVVEAGTKSRRNKIFSGIVRQAKITPVFDDPKYVVLSISGADVLSLLNGKKYTRRCKATKACWVSITGVNRRGLKSGKFKYKKEDTIFLSKDDPTSSTGLNSTSKAGSTAAFKGAEEVPTAKSVSSGKNVPYAEVKIIVDSGEVSEA